VVASLGDVVIEKIFDVADGEDALFKLIFAARTVNLTGVLADACRPMTEFWNGTSRSRGATSSQRSPATPSVSH
jgi:hypothetical protein